MNKVILIGRLTKDPNVRYSQGNEPMAIARFTLAVNRRRKKGEEQTADFISCVAFGKQGEFIEKYTHKGTKLVISGRIQSGQYTNKDGQTVYTTDVVCEDIEFAESKSGDSSSGSSTTPSTAPSSDDGFMNVEEDIDEEFPFR